LWRTTARVPVAGSAMAYATPRPCSGARQIARRALVQAALGEHQPRVVGVLRASTASHRPAVTRT
jgi:hypothetical protein